MEDARPRLLVTWAQLLADFEALHARVPRPRLQLSDGGQIIESPDGELVLRLSGSSEVTESGRTTYVSGETTYAVWDLPARRLLQSWTRSYHFDDSTARSTHLAFAKAWFSDDNSTLTVRYDRGRPPDESFKIQR